jgi:hypothetical protein
LDLNLNDHKIRPSDNGKKIDENEKRKKPNPVSGFGNNPIYPVLSTWISTWIVQEAL